MRRIKRKDDERGAVAVIIALLLVVLLGFGAIAVDVGMLYAEKAQLRNGADAGALSIAQSCAYDSTTSNPHCNASVGSSSLAKQMADSNALDGISNARHVELDKAAGKVAVTVGALETGTNANRVSLFFARALGIEEAEVGVTSHAVWGSPRAGFLPFPLTVSICQVQGLVGGGIKLIQSHGSGAHPSCNYGPSGQTVPGGFAWLTPDTGKCGASVDVNIAESYSDPGNNGPTFCTDTLNAWASAISAGNHPIIFLPVHDRVTGTGNNAVYNVQSFAAFRVHGWKFHGSDNLPLTFRNTASAVGSAAECTGNCRGIIGEFIKYVSLGDGYRLGAPNANGANVVKLTLGDP